MSAIQQPMPGPPSRFNRIGRAVLIFFNVFYIIASLLLIVHTRQLMAKNETLQQQIDRKLIQRQIDTQIQLSASTEALARRLGQDEHDFQSQIDAKSGNLRRQQRDLVRRLQSQAEQQQQQQLQVGQVAGEVSAVRTELGGAKTEIAATRTELATTNSKLDGAIGDLSGHSHLIARTRDELEELRHKGDRNYYEFALTKGRTPISVSSVSLQLKKVDVKRNKFTLNVMADDRTIEKKDRGVAEPLQFYTGRDRLLYEVVIWTTEKNRVTGYLSTPKTATNVTVAGN